MGFSSSNQQAQNQSQQTSVSQNQAYPYLQGALGSQVANAGTGSGAISNMLGLNGSAAGSQAFDNYKNSSNYNFIQDQGVRGITSSNAAKGLLGSGSTLRGIADYSSNLAGNFLNNYMSQLSGLSQSGIQAGQVLSSAGNTANSQGTSYGTSHGSSTDFKLG